MTLLVHPAPLPPEPSLRRTAYAGMLLVVLAFGGFGAWAGLADLDSATIAPGSIIADSRRKTVQHLEGGILQSLLVKEGDMVRAGQVLLRLDDTQAAAVLGQLRSQQWSALARLARLQAEAQERHGFEIPPELAAVAGDPRVDEAIAGEGKLLSTRWETYEGQKAVLGKRIEQGQREIVANQAQAAASAERRRLTEDELGSVRKLLDKGFERKPRLLELQRAVADLHGRESEYLAGAAQAEQAIAAARLEIANLKNVWQAETARQIQETQALLVDLAERIRAADDIARRKAVVAPQGGKVVDIRFYTPGGVIGAGMPILDIVPADDEMVVEARVHPDDIDVVHVGLPARVRLTAFKQREVPPVGGTVTYVSADAQHNERTGEPYFTARLSFAADAFQGLDRVALHPGMPTEVMIVTGERRAADYFLSPITHSLRRAFREE